MRDLAQLAVEGRKRGVIVDVGANDGVFEDWSRQYEHAGWRVLCIEGNPDNEEALAANREEYVIAVVGAREEDAEFHIHKCGHGNAACTGLKKSRSSAWVEVCSRGRWPLQRVINVKVRTLSSLFKEHAITDIDLLGMDIEGGELAALRGLDFDMWKPEFIQCENYTGESKVRTFLEGKGYEYVHAKCDELYRRADA